MNCRFIRFITVIALNFSFARRITMLSLNCRFISRVAEAALNFKFARRITMLSLNFRFARLVTVFALIALSFVTVSRDALAQMERTRVESSRPVELTFPASRHIQLITTEPLARGELYYSIMHVFGRLENGIDDFWGLDQGANIRFSIEYGFTDRFSLFFGRSSMDKLYDMGTRYHLLRQMTRSGMPVSVSVTITGGIMTRGGGLLEQDFDFSDRLSLALSLPISRKFSDRLSLMLSPSAAVISKTDSFLNLENTTDLSWIGAGTGGRFKYSSRGSVTLQYIPSMGTETGNISHNFGIGLDLETGGHVFQIFFTNTRSLNDAWMLAGRTDDLAITNLRFGFNINRSFVVR